MSYRERVFKSFGWVSGLRLLTRSIAVIKVIILARILAPAQFGQVAIAMLLLEVLEVFTETGINIVLIQKGKEFKSYLNSAWVATIVRGLFIFLVMVIASPFVANFFKTPQALWLILLLSVVPLVRGFINPAFIAFQKELKFNKEFYFKGVLLIIDAVVAIFVAVTTKSASSVIIGIMATAICELILSFWFIKPIPRFTIELTKLKNILHAGKWITLSGIFNYFFHNGDDIAVGRLLNAASLGIYDVAYKIAILPITEIADSISRITLPVFSKISNDVLRLKKAFFSTTAALALFSLSAGALVYFFIDPLVDYLLGEKWLATIPVIKVLTIFALIRTVSSSCSVLFYATERQKYVSYATFASMIGLGISVVPLVQRFGLIGAAYSAIIGSISSLPVFIFYTIKIFRKS